MNRQELIELLANHFSEWTDDNAPLGMSIYRAAAEDFVNKHPELVTD